MTGRPSIRRSCDVCGALYATHTLVHDLQEWHMCRFCWSQHNRSLLDTLNIPTEDTNG